MMEKITRKISTALIPLLVLVMSIVAFGAASIGVFATSLIIETTGSFDSPDEKYKCYHITGDATGIAIGWNKAPSATDTNHVVPSTITVGGTAYTVKAIVEGGFRGCDFETIRLPDAVKEIREEAFAYCLNLTSFTIPTGVTEIAPSTFLDDRALERVYYSNGSGGTTNSNNKVTSIGDHAFTNCMSLLSFPCSSTLVSIGESAFQKCSKMMSFFFPSKNAASNWTNNITVGKYAFADCTSMTLCYFEENLDGVGEFAFAECEKLKLYYTGATAPTHSSNANYDVNWRRWHTAANRDVDPVDYVPIETGTGHIYETNDYPGLYYTIETAQIDLDQKTNSSKKTKIHNSSTFAKVFKFETPNRNVPGYWNSATGALTIPNQVKDQSNTNRTVKILASNAFSENTDIKSVSFNAGLVQICNRAFLNCTEIESLDFSACTALTEVSYEIFQGKTGSVNNEHLTSLKLPKCLKYIGAYAFYKFVNVADFSFMANPGDDEDDIATVFIGRYAFAYLGYNCTDAGDGTGKGTGEVDLILSAKLHEGECGEYVPTNLDKTPYETSYESWTSPVLPYAFQNANCLRSVKVWNTGVATGTKPRSSFGVGAFQHCKSLIRFVSNKQLCYIGSGCFQGCVAIKELFLYATYCTGQVTSYVAWGHNGQNGTWGNSIFGGRLEGVSYPNAVIYVNTAADGIPSYNRSTGTGRWWNADPSDKYIDGFGASDDYGLYRTTIPTYYNVSCSTSGDLVDWSSGVKYLDLTDNSLNGTFDDSHDTVAMVKNGGAYIAARCYCTANRATVDLTLNTTLNPGAGDPLITEIGSGCFAQIEGEPVPGTTIYLPTSVTAIRERAFFRHDTANPNASGALIVTYKSSPSSSPAAIAGKTGYCKLPESVTRIEAMAFYNNRFQAVDIEGDLAFLGTGAFSTLDAGDTNPRATLTGFDLASGNTHNLDVSGNGFYYTETGKKTLLQQATALTGNFTVAADTVAIASHALANTGYSKISIPTSVTTIYGNALTRSFTMTEFAVPSGSNLQYIGSAVPGNLVSGASFDWFQRSANVGQTSWDTYARYASSLGAFKKCKSLTTVDFTNMTNLKKIGYGAFEDCKVMANMTGSKTYSYFKWNSGKTALEAITANTSSGVLDLSGCSNLVSIGRNSFVNCKGIQYVHLPDSDNLYVGMDYDLYDYRGMQGVSEEKKDGAITAVKLGKSPFDGTGSDGKGATILVGQKADIASENGARTLANKYRYPNKSLIGATKAYFHFTSSSDFIGEEGESGTRYWTELDGVDRCYLLCTNRAEAQAWLNKSVSEKAALIAAAVGS